MTNQPIQGAVLRPSSIAPIERGGGITTRPLVGPSIGEVSILSGITEFPPAAALHRHAHNCEESVMLVSGRGTIEIDGESVPLQAGDVTWVPADVPHRFINDSGTEPMRIFWTYASAQATRTDPATGETHTILSEHEAGR